MRTSKYLKVDKDILIEYIYDDNNLIGEDYSILVNIQNNEKSFVSGNNSGINNKKSQQLFLLDPVTNKYGLINTALYNFLQLQDYAGGVPIRYDIIRIHFPINYVFDDKLGFYLKAYTFDYYNRKTYNLSNFYYDKSDPTTIGTLNFTAPPFLFQEKLWGKYIDINVPAVYSTALQRENNAAKNNSLNYNLAGVDGLSISTPIFIDFSFIKAQQVINSVKTYSLDSPTTITIPQVPEFENLAVKIEESSNGDYFEIYGIFNGNIAEFKKFMDNAYLAGNNYYAEFDVTIYEENIKGKTVKFVLYDNFNEKIEFRPIIKFSTTTAVIDVLMRLIDKVDNSQIIRRASFGILQDQIAKYGRNLTKINISKANKPKIYGLKNTISDENGLASRLNAGSKVQLQKVEIPFPVLIDKFNLVAKSDSVRVKKDTYFGIGKLQLTIYPFDNVILINIASKVDDVSIVPFDLTSASEIKMVFKNSAISVEAKLYSATGRIDLKRGVVVFRINQNQIGDIRKIHDSGVNAFYITTSANNSTTVIYSGTYRMYDDKDNLADLTAQTNKDLNTPDGNGSGGIKVISSGEGSKPEETAIITRKAVPNNKAVSGPLAVSPNISSFIASLKSQIASATPIKIGPVAGQGKG